MTRYARLELTPPTDQRLNKRSRSVPAANVTSEQTQNVIEQMLLMAAGKGHSAEDTRQMVGLAAPQVGVLKRIVLIDLTADGSLKKQTLQVVINPVITRKSATTIQGREGCWSCGNICGVVERAEAVTVTGLDYTGEPITLDLTGFVARIAQHEVDHLDGIRFPDRIPADQHSRLHWVLPEQFNDYRQNWQHWPTLCPREKWEALKASKVTTL